MIGFYKTERDWVLQKFWPADVYADYNTCYVATEFYHNVSRPQKNLNKILK